MKTSFNLDDYKGNYGMHCKTEDEADSFLEVLHNAGRRWLDGTSYIDANRYDKYKHYTVYCFNKGTYGSTALSGYTILEWSDFTEGEDKEEISEEEFHDMLSNLLGINIRR